MMTRTATVQQDALRDDPQRCEAELVVAQASVDQIAAELNSTLRELESAADQGDVDRVMVLRTAAHVELPARLATARIELIDAQIARYEMRLSMVDSELVDQTPLLEAAQKAYADATGALENNRKLQHERFDLNTSVQQLRRQRESTAAEADAARRSATRRLAGLDVVEDAVEPDLTNIHIDLPEISQRDIDRTAVRS